MVWGSCVMKAEAGNVTVSLQKFTTGIWSKSSISWPVRSSLRAYTSSCSVCHTKVHIMCRPSYAVPNLQLATFSCVRMGGCSHVMLPLICSSCNSVVKLACWLRAVINVSRSCTSSPDLVVKGNSDLRTPFSVMSTKVCRANVCMNQL